MFVCVCVCLCVSVCVRVIVCSVLLYLLLNMLVGIHCVCAHRNLSTNLLTSERNARDTCTVATAIIQSTICTKHFHVSSERKVKDVLGVSPVSFSLRMYWESLQ